MQGQSQRGGLRGGRRGFGGNTRGFGGDGGDRRREREAARQQMYPGILQGEPVREYRQRIEVQRRQAAREAEQKAREEAARKAAEEAAARRAQQEQQRIAQEAAARQAAEAAAQQAAAQEAAAKAAEEARQKAEQERLAAIEEQRRKDAEAAQQRQAQAQALGTVVTTGPGSLNRPADPLPKYRGYTPLDYDVSKTGSLTDQYARMLNVPFFQPFIAQEDINLAPGATTADSIFGVESLLPNYTFDPLSQTASNPYFSARQGGRVQKDMGGFIGFMDEPLNIMHPTGKIDVVDGGISSILKKYKEIRSEL